MLGFIWDGVAPLLIIWSAIGCMQIYKHWPKVKRVCKVLRTVPLQIETAWKAPPQPPTIQNHNSSNSQPQTPPPPFLPPSFDHLKTAPETGMALLNPPTLVDTVRHLQTLDPNAQYLFPYGWYVQSNHRNHQPIADLVFTDLGAETYNLAVLGSEGYGKTSWVLAGMMALTIQRKPREIQFAIFNLKDADFHLMECSAYTFLLAQTAEQLPHAIKKLHAEAKRRAALLACHHLLTWNEYRGNDLPLLVVYIDDPAAISTILGKKLTDHLLTILMAYGPALGFRIIIESPRLSFLTPRCQDFLSDRLFGPSEEDPRFTRNGNEPPVSSVPRQGVIMPTRLTKEHSGVFTVIDPTGNALTLRGVHVPVEARKRWLALQPRQPRKPAVNGEQLPGNTAPQTHEEDVMA